MDWLISDEKIYSPLEDHPAGGSVEEEVVIFCPALPGFLYGTAGGELFLGRCRLPGRWLFRLGRWFPHAKDE